MCRECQNEWPSEEMKGQPSYYKGKNIQSKTCKTEAHQCLESAFYMTVQQNESRYSIHCYTFIN